MEKVEELVITDDDNDEEEVCPNRGKIGETFVKSGNLQGDRGFFQ